MTERDDKVFEFMTASADNTRVNFNEKPAREYSSDDIHKVLMAAGFTPGLGNIADAIDAFPYVLEGDFENAAISTAAMVPLAGQFVNGRRALKAAEEAGEPDYADAFTEEAELLPQSEEVMDGTLTVTTVEDENPAVMPEPEVGESDSTEISEPETGEGVEAPPLTHEVSDKSVQKFEELLDDPNTLETNEAISSLLDDLLGGNE